MERHYLVSSLEFRKKLKNVSDSEYRRLRDNYDDFLEQPLKLEMFVPCDEEGNILEEPKRWEDYLQYPDSFDGNKEWGELYDYQQAKEKVLFVFKLNFYILLMKHHILQGRNIEYLANFAELELTESAVKQIVL